MFGEAGLKEEGATLCRYCYCRIRKPLTDEEMLAVYSSIYGAGTDRENLLEMGRAVERAHEIGEQK